MLAGGLLLAADLMVEGVHFDLDLVTLEDVGWKALARNLSDVAAMGGDAGHAVVSVAAPAGTDLDLLYDGLLAAAEAMRCPVVGGDLSSSPALVVSIAVTGSIEGAPVLRSGARPGNTIVVTGPLGAAAAGLELLRAGRGGEAPDLVWAHARPQPRLAEGRAAAAAGATSMIDVSDGLAVDLNRIARASGVGVVLDHVPVAVGVERVAEERAEAMALGGGDDYELVITTGDPDGLADAFVEQGLARPLVIGHCTADASQLLDAVGWEHEL